MKFINDLFNKKTQKVINDYKNKLPEDIQYIDSYIEIMKLALEKNNITTVKLFYSFDGRELFDKIKNENSSKNILVLYKGHVDNLIAKNGYINIYHSKRGNYSLVVFQHQFIYEELFELNYGMMEVQHLRKYMHLTVTCQKKSIILQL